MLINVLQAAELLFSEFKDEEDRDRIRHALATAYRYREEKLIVKQIEQVIEQLKRSVGTS